MLCTRSDDKMNIDEYMNDMSDDELIKATKEAYNDLTIAAKDEPNSEWHQSCFAATILFADEMAKRGLKISTVH